MTFTSKLLQILDSRFIEMFLKSISVSHIYFGHSGSDAQDGCHAYMVKALQSASSS